MSVSVTEEQKAALEDIAERNDVSLARVVQEAIKKFLHNHKDRQLALLFDPPTKLPPKG